MRRARVVLAWAALLAAIAAVQLAFRPDAMSLLLGAGSAMFVALLAPVAAFAGRHPSGEPEPVPDLSLPTVVLALGASAAVTGAEVGLWLVLIGTGLAALGAVGLARELRAERRDGGRR